MWRAESWSPYGELLQESGDPSLRPIWRFFGQIALEGSNAEGWLDGNIVDSRPELYLNRWRVYDPQVGQYTSPEPLALDGRQAATHPYGYANLAPTVFTDSTGRFVDTCSARADICLGTLGAVGYGAGLADSVPDAEPANDNACEREDAPPRAEPATPDPPDDDDCDEQRIACFSSGLADLRSGTMGSNRCNICYQACKKDGYWSSRITSHLTGRKIRCDYWNY